MGSFKEVFKHAVTQIFQNKRRLFKAAIYSIYIYLFIKRFFSVLKYFKGITMGLASKHVTFMRSLWQETITFIQKLFDLNPAANASSNKSILKIIFTHLYRIAGLILGLMSMPTQKKSGSFTRMMFRLFFHHFLSLLAFVYNSFIFVQLSCIGVAESQRIRRLILNAFNQTKRLRVHESTEEVKDQEEQLSVN